MSDIPFPNILEHPELGPAFGELLNDLKLTETSARKSVLDRIKVRFQRFTWRVRGFMSRTKMRFVNFLRNFSQDAKMWWRNFERRHPWATAVVHWMVGFWVAFTITMVMYITILGTFVWLLTRFE